MITKGKKKVNKFYFSNHLTVLGILRLYNRIIFNGANRILEYKHREYEVNFLHVLI